MWYNSAQLNTPQTPEDQIAFSNNTSDTSSKPYALDVAPDVASKANKFISNGKPLQFKAKDGKRYLMIHGSPDGYFNTGEPQVNKGDGNPTNNGFVHRDQLPEWLRSKGWNGSISIIACYGGRMEPIQYSGGNVKSLFRNKGKIGFSTHQDQQGNNRFLFQG